MFGRIGFQEILILMAILVFLFGAKKIPELARGMGLGVKEFKKGLQELQEEEAEEEEEEDAGQQGS
ncbi:MAG: twin-arginine translocase TatA/TatE family subunit [bacterium]